MLADPDSATRVGCYPRPHLKMKCTSAQPPARAVSDSIVETIQRNKKRRIVGDPQTSTRGPCWMQGAVSCKTSSNQAPPGVAALDHCFWGANNRMEPGTSVCVWMRIQISTLTFDLDPGSDATSSPHALFVFDSQSFFPLSSYRLHCAEEPALLHYCTALLSLGSGKSTQAAARAISSAPLLEPFFFLSYRSGLISLACLSSLASQPSPASHLPGALRRCLPRFYATTSPLSAAHLLSTDVLRHFNRSISPVRSRAS